MAMHIWNPNSVPSGETPWRTIRAMYYSPDIPGFNAALVYSPNVYVQNGGNWSGELDQINLVSETITVQGGTAEWSLRTTGLTNIVGNSSLGSDIQIWCVNPSNVGQYEVRASNPLNSGGAFGGDQFDAWLPLNNNRAWSLTDQFDTNGSFLVEIKNILTGQLLVGVNIYLAVIYND
jgi:hypothetical protein